MRPQVRDVLVLVLLQHARRERRQQWSARATCDGISRICSCEITVPEVAAVVSISGASAVTVSCGAGGADLKLEIDLLVVAGLQDDALAFEVTEAGGGNVKL